MNSEPAGPKILLIDDEADLLAVLVRLLNNAGYRTETARSAEEGITLVAAHPFDAVIMDIGLPGLSGLQALAELQKTCRAPIFLMSGHTDDDIREDALLLGAKDLLNKPLDIETIKTALAAVLR